MKADTAYEMISQSTVIRTAPQQDLMNELRFFIRGTTKKEKCSPLDLTKSSLILLKCLPASRVAIFEYFSKVFESAALNYIEGIEVGFNLMIHSLLYVAVYCRLKLKQETSHQYQSQTSWSYPRST